MDRTFIAYDENDQIIQSSSGQACAARKVIDALYSYREEFKNTHGKFYGSPWLKGYITVDGEKTWNSGGYYFANELIR